MITVLFLHHEVHSQPGVFVSTVHIGAAARALRVPIFVKFPDKTQRFGSEVTPAAGPTIIYLSFQPPFSSGHFQCLVPADAAPPAWPLVCLVRAKGFSRPLCVGDEVPDLTAPPLFRPLPAASPGPQRRAAPCVSVPQVPAPPEERVQEPGRAADCIPPATLESPAAERRPDRSLPGETEAPRGVPRGVRAWGGPRPGAGQPRGKSQRGASVAR